MIYRLTIHIHPQGSREPVLVYALPSYRQAYKMVQSAINTAINELRVMPGVDNVTLRWSITGWSKGRVRELKHGFVNKRKA